MSVVVCHEPGYVLVAVAGEIDIAAAPALRACLWPLLDGDRPVVADLDQVSFIDAAGLGLLADATRRAAACATSVHVVCSRPQTLRLVRLTGLDRLVRLAGTRAEAIGAAVGTATRAAPAADGR